MADTEHIRRELSKAMPTGPQIDHVQIKARSQAGESHWVNIPVNVFRRVVTAACIPEWD